MPPGSISSRMRVERLATAASSTCLTASTRMPSRSKVSSHHTASSTNCSAAWDVGPVHVRQVGREQALQPLRGPVAAGGAAHATGAEPIRMRLEVLVVLVHVVDHVVHQDANAVGVGFLHQRVQRGLAAQARVHLARLDRPVAVVAGDQVVVVGGEVRIARVGLERRQPQGAHAELVQRAVGDLLAHAFQITPLVVPARILHAAGGRRIVATDRRLCSGPS